MKGMIKVGRWANEHKHAAAAILDPRLALQYIGLSVHKKPVLLLAQRADQDHLIHTGSPTRMMTGLLLAWHPVPLTRNGLSRAERKGQEQDTAE